MPVKTIVVDNPVLSRILIRLRDRGTGRAEFCRLMELAGMLLGYEASGSLPRRIERVITPLGAEAAAEVVDVERVVVVAVLRAALPMAWGVLRVLEGASLGLVAASRLEDTKRIEDGRIVFDVDIPYMKTPSVYGKTVLLVDPMLATGSSVSRIASRILSEKPEKLILLSLISTREGISRVEEAAGRQEVIHYTGAVDPYLNERGFIVPGLGDAGDRCFGS